MWTSARRRAYHTAWPFVQSGYKVTQKAIMSEINPYAAHFQTCEAKLTGVQGSVGWSVVAGGNGAISGRVGAIPRGPICSSCTKSRVISRSQW